VTIEVKSMTGFKVAKRAIVLAAASLPAIAVAGQSNTAAPQTIPGLDNFSIPSSRPLATPSPTPSPSIVPTPSATPVFKRVQPTPTPTATRTSSPVARTTPSAVDYTIRRELKGIPQITEPTPSASATPTPTPAATPAPQSAPSTPVAAAPAAGPSPAATSIPPAQPSSGASPGLIAAAVIALLLLAGGAFTFLRRRRTIDDHVAVEPIAPAPAPPPPSPAPVPAAALAVPPNAPEPAPRVTARTIDEDRPEIEITLIPKRAGTNLTSAAIDYQIVLRNIGSVAARDIRFGIYMLSASANQANDLQMIFAAPVEQSALPPFELAAGADVQLSGMALLPRENVNVMTIDGKPWFVPVLAMKAEYRWGENVGAPGVAAAAHMIGIDRGEGAKMAPFRLDTGPHMHPGVAHRRVA
jgi:hypothetical protein